MTRQRAFLIVAVLVGLAGATFAATAVTLDDFSRVLASIPLASQTRVIAALELGLKNACCTFPVNETYRLFERLAAASGNAADKEAIVLVFAQGIEKGLPLTSLLSKASEGLARGVSLSSLGSLLAQRLKLLEQTRDLFYSRGVFRAAPGAPVAAGATALPASRFDALLSEVGDALGDYVEGGGSPFESQKIYDEVRARLALLSGSVLSAADVELLMTRIGPADLTQVILAALR